ncbi:MAG: SDR family NAD(P)-dependent oxidoreductase [Myxococcota bacterium]
MKKLENRVAVVTGAGGGIGGALARELAGRGCHLALVDVGADALAASAEAVAHSGVRVSQHVTDVSDRQRMSRLPDAVLEAHGAVHLLVNNAGITLQKSFATHSLEDWDRVVGVNWWGVLHGCHFFLDALRAAEEAHIVNLSSMVGFAGLPMQSSYCATKAAVKGLSESLWAELANEGIGVTAVHPGAIRTEMIQATLAESDDLEFAKRSYDLAQRVGCSPEKAARRIVDAVVRGKLRVRIGADSFLLDWLKRCLPVAIHKPMRRIVDAPPASPG